MGIVINPRGTAGSGKTELARRILAQYGWPSARQVETIFRVGRTRPLAYRLAHPSGGRSLAVLGEYRGCRGGCDTIGLADGGLAGALQLAGDFLADGNDVLIEGLTLSAEHRLSGRFAQTRPLHVLRLDTRIEQSVRNLMARRHASRRARPEFMDRLAAEQAAVTEACAQLEPVATVEVLSFDAALRRARILLGLDGAGAGREACG